LDAAEEIMSDPCIITVAITGSVPKKKDNPSVPISVSEQLESTHAAYEAGASLVHVHVRNDDGSTTSDPDRFARFLEGARKHFPDRIYENPPDFIEGLAQAMLDNGVKPEIEVFDLAMLYNAASLVQRGLLKPQPHVQFVLGIPNALPADRQVLEFELAQLERVLPGATWTAAGVGKHQIVVNEWTLELGGHCRTGLEDNVRFDKSRLAASNAELVTRVAELAGSYGRSVATPAEARRILGLRAA
jgi:uncharacterized protein (DUF849 family)